MTALDIYAAEADSEGVCPRCSVPFSKGDRIVWAENDGWAYKNNPGRWQHACKCCMPEKFMATNGAGNEKEVRNLLGH